jgi:hypothetical protein
MDIKMVKDKKMGMKKMRSRRRRGWERKKEGKKNDVKEVWRGKGGKRAGKRRLVNECSETNGMNEAIVWPRVDTKGAERSGAP